MIQYEYLIEKNKWGNKSSKGILIIIYEKSANQFYL